MRSEIRDLGKFGTRNWAQRSAGIRTWGRNRAVKTNRLVGLCVLLILYAVDEYNIYVCHLMLGRLVAVRL